MKRDEMTPEYDPYSAQQPEPGQRTDPPAGSGRRRRAPEPEQYAHSGGYADPDEARGIPGAGYPESQWERSGLGWDPGEWDDSQQGAAVVDGVDRGAPDGYRDEGRGGYGDGGYASEYEAPRGGRPDTVPAPGRGRGREADFYAADDGYHRPADPDDYERGRGQGRSRGSERSRGRADFDGPGGLDGLDGRGGHNDYNRYDDYDGADPGFGRDDRGSDRDGQDAPARRGADLSPRSPARPAGGLAARASGVAALTGGAGAFGAAGVSVVVAVAALAATQILTVVVALAVVGLAVGWSRTVGLARQRLTVVLIALIGLAAVGIGYRDLAGSAAGDVISALGLGFLALAVNQIPRRGTKLALHKYELLARSAAGAAFAVLPAGFVVAQRLDSRLAAAGALAGAAAVLCGAMVGGGRGATGVAAGIGAGTALGALTALTLSSPAGAAGGALAGVTAALFALAGARTADRLALEGEDVRITAQLLPVAFAAIGTGIAALAMH